MKFIETLKNVWKIEELRNRIIVTLGLLLVYRFGAQVVLPGIDAAQLEGLQGSTEDGLLGLLNAFTGGAFANASVFCIGYYALYLGFYCSSVNGNCHSVFAKITKRRC